MKKPKAQASTQPGSLPIDLAAVVGGVKAPTKPDRVGNETGTG